MATVSDNGNWSTNNRSEPEEMQIDQQTCGFDQRKSEVKQRNQCIQILTISWNSWINRGSCHIAHNCWMIPHVTK